MKSHTSTAAEATPAESLHLACAETFGGNRQIHTTFELPGARGLLFSKPSDGRKGGDLHYLSICSNGLMSRFLLADVAGHGEAVSSVSGQLHQLVRRYGSALDHRRLLVDLNLWLVEHRTASLVTAAAFTYEAPARLLFYSSAGHPPAWYYRASERRWVRLPLEDGAVVRPSRSRPRRGAIADLPLAIDQETKYSRRRIRVTPGDRLLILTDGVLEAPSPAGNLFGDAGVEQLLANAPDSPPAALSDRLLSSICTHTGRSDFEHDDVSFLLIELLATPGPALWQVIRNRILQPRGNSADPHWDATLNPRLNVHTANRSAADSGQTTPR